MNLNLTRIALAAAIFAATAGSASALNPQPLPPRHLVARAMSKATPPPRWEAPAAPVESIP